MDDRASVRQRRILITGATGFTGGHACRYFAAQGYQVAALVRKIPPGPVPEGITYYICDLMNKAELDQLIYSVAPDAVLHLGGKNSVPESWKDPLLYMETNVLPTIYLLNSLRGFPDSRIVIAGSMAVFPLTPPLRPPHPYSLSKSLQKAAVLSWEVLFDQTVILAEPSNLIGPGPSTGFCALLARHIAAWEQTGKTEPFRISSKKARRDFLDVRDAVKAYELLLDKGTRGHTVTISSGIYHTLEEVALQMLGISGTEAPLAWGDEPDAAASKEAHPGEIDMGSLGWRPEIPIGTSLRDVLEHFRKQKGDVR